MSIPSSVYLKRGIGVGLNSENLELKTGGGLISHTRLSDDRQTRGDVVRYKKGGKGKILCNIETEQNRCTVTSLQHNERRQNSNTRKKPPIRRRDRKSYLSRDKRMPWQNCNRPQTQLQ